MPRVGLIGAGWIARDHLEILGLLEDVSVVAVCDVDEARAREAAGPHGADVHSDWEALLESTELDAVWVCTPPLHHREPAVAALERGLGVYLEKPVARTLDDAAAIVAAWRASEAVCAVGYQWHAIEVLTDLREALAGQEISLLVGRNIGATQSRPWFLDRAQGGGNILERASHHLDLQRAVAGDVVRVQAAGSAISLAQGEEEAQGDIEDAVILVLHFEHGSIGTIQVAWTRKGLPGAYDLDVFASEATLRLDLDPDFRLHGPSCGREVDVRSAMHPFERGIRRFLEANAAGDKDAVFCTPEDAERTLAVAAACEEALASGRTVDVPTPTPA